MPLYEYECEKCGARFEAITRITEKDETECPECGAPAARQMSSFSLGGAVTSGTGKSCFTGG
jgi:putative FmdB family regulatory protein